MEVDLYANRYGIVRRWVTQNAEPWFGTGPRIRMHASKVANYQWRVVPFILVKYTEDHSPSLMQAKNMVEA